MLAAFKILRAAAAPIFESSGSAEKSTPDYYKILEVERFSHINTIKKQYKKLALTLHPDKNPLLASEEAFKLVGEAARMLSDKIRRKEYDMRLRVAMQSTAADEVGLGAEQTFWTACSICQLLHQFERKYLGHNLMCPGCKKTFKLMEVEENMNNGANVDGVEKNEGVEGWQTRVSTRVRERVAKGGYVGISENSDLGVKRKIRSVGEISERLGLKAARTKGVEKVGKLGEGDGGGIEESTSRRPQTLVDVDGSKSPSTKGIGGVNDLISRRAGKKLRVGFDKASESGEIEILESDRTKRAKAREEENMTLSQMQMLVKKKKLVDGPLSRKETEVNTEKLEAKKKGIKIENDEERESEKEKENVRDEKRQEEKEKDKNEKEIVNLKEKIYRRRVSTEMKLEVVSKLQSEIVEDRSLQNDNLEVLLVEKGDGKEKEKEMKSRREKRERCRFSKYGNLDVVQTNTSKNNVSSEIERFVTNKQGSLEVMPVEDSDFHDFDNDRSERSFKKGQVWAVYDDDDGMPRHYALINEIVAINPFDVTLNWLQFQSNGDEELVSRVREKSHISCGIFQVSREVTVRYPNLFSHLVDCERAAREVYRIYPKKGSVWAMYNSNSSEDEERNQGVERCYDIVVSLSSYSDIHGTSIAYLEKVSGFRTVFKRREIGANAVVCLRANDIKLFSHQIPAKKLSSEESAGLPKDCWELDPASLTPQLLIAS